jgi:flagellar motor switch protein FliG
LATALASAQQTGMSDVATYLLESMSKRMADNLREEITELGKVKASEGETAMKEIMIEIRRLIDAGEVEIIIPSDEDETETSES